MNKNPYYQELVDFRQTLQAWLNGVTPKSEENKVFDRLLGIVPEDNTYIRGNGILYVQPNDNLSGFRQSHGEMPNFKMWLEDFRVLWERDDLALVSFIEWSESDHWEPFGMQSSVLFRKKADTPFGVEWLHHQETIIEQSET